MRSLLIDSFNATEFRLMLLVLGIFLNPRSGRVDKIILGRNGLIGAYKSSHILLIPFRDNFSLITAYQGVMNPHLVLFYHSCTHL